MFKKKKVAPTEDTPRDNFDKYRSAAVDWDHSNFRRQRAILFAMWVYSCLATIAIVALALAIAKLAPLKTVEPYLIRVDSSTGIAETLTKNDLQNTKWSESEHEAIDRYFLTKYVRAREGYNYALRVQQYLDVSVMSSAAIAAAYQQYANRDNPNSPLNLLGRNKIAEVRIKSISWPQSDDPQSKVAYVRFLRQVSTIDSTGQHFQPEHLLATINYRYINAEIDNEARQSNPLGFLVTAYQVTSEAQIVERNEQ